MLSQIFLGLSLLGAEWVLYVLIGLSILSVAIMFERSKFYRSASRDLDQFRAQIRKSLGSGQSPQAIDVIQARLKEFGGQPMDLETQMTLAVLESKNKKSHVLNEAAQDSVLRLKILWEKNLAVLATIGNNAPFVGLFGTVLGIIKAFHDLSQQSSQGAQTVTAGVSEALVATAVGLLVAIPAVIAYNLFQRKVKAALADAESLKSFLIGKIGE